MTQNSQGVGVPITPTVKKNKKQRKVSHAHLDVWYIVKSQIYIYLYIIYIYVYIFIYVYIYEICAMNTIDGNIQHLKKDKRSSKQEINK